MKLIVCAASKGGVGKSLISINVAFALRDLGYSAGLLDTDIMMPAITRYLNLEDVDIDTHDMIEPAVRDGVQIFSPGMLMDKDQPVLIGTDKRELMVSQFIKKVNWGVDYLVIDTPPGATDELQYILRTYRNELKGVIIVTTSSEVAITQVRRSIELFRRMRLPIIGIIGNMASFECANCHKVENLFNNGTAEPVDVVAADFRIKIIAKIPIYQHTDQDPLHFVRIIAGGLKSVGI